MSRGYRHPLYLAAQVREIDRRIIASQEAGDGFVLMQRAALAAYQQLRQHWPLARHVCVVCGAGNNAGDGYIIAALAARDGLEVSLIAVRSPENLKGDAARAYAMATAEALNAQSWQDGMALPGEVVVDALLGTGLGGEVREPFASAIAAINDSGLPVLAVDVPSGLSADTGSVLGAAVDADVTVTFIADKFGLHTGKAGDHVGRVVYRALGIEPQAQGDIEPQADLLDAGLVREAFPPRRRTSHKGNHGHLLVIGGAPGFGGAALLASEAGARLGAGKVSLATAPEHVGASLIRTPEIMARGVRGVSDAEPLVDMADVIVVGPGLGKDAWGQGMLQVALDSGKPLVIDADGLNLLALYWPDLQRDDWLLTPHPGEAGRLLESSSAAIEGDRLSAVRDLQQRRHGAIVLKGAGTLVAGPMGIGVCPYGNPGMASGGTGDVLSGMLGSLIAQGLPLEQAARTGVTLHALAADLAAQKEGERGLLAGDLASYARILMNLDNGHSS
ncbi:bifunctional ADP-dependent NAD(P)H-hydrate dehydratase/NAD(P)H-hydrate epimerase [Modicisalibacter luteus]|uniref:Bifunctional NAD(P)H-hydrate repair enzyme n=1 Tax=Modicisalibacter luteus TaxID=453962 RepID=A0ABV7LYY5_9GAMM|nr:bifunctional ADP-dependent NAD(P)H-hydrate dehydratase/NAD(P)H-hydrate epimerase [Halomonas lutea]GHA95612.1 bifunctional NAD(P)H-hydrate repair enzyme [Halomonas lutea]